MTVLPTFSSFLSSFAKLTAAEVKVISREVRGALLSSRFGIGTHKRFLQNDPSEIQNFCRKVAAAGALRSLHLGSRTDPPYWPIERAAIVFVNNAVKLRKAKEKSGNKRKRGDDSDSAEEDVEMGSNGDTLPLNYVNKMQPRDYKAGACFGYLSSDVAKACGAQFPIGKGPDCSSSKGMDPLCQIAVKPDKNKALGTTVPSTDFVVVAIVKMNNDFGHKVKVPWLELYSAGPDVDRMKSKNWTLRPGQVLFWKKENIWEFDGNRSIVPMITKDKEMTAGTKKTK